MALKQVCFSFKNISYIYSKIHFYGHKILSSQKDDMLVITKCYIGKSKTI